MNEHLAEGRRQQRLPKPSLNVIHHSIDLLKPDPRNTRVHSKRQIRQIARSIETFGFNVPLLVDADLQVIAGHGRLLAARQLGFSEVPTISLEHLTPAQAKVPPVIGALNGFLRSTVTCCDHVPSLGGPKSGPLMLGTYWITWVSHSPSGNTAKPSSHVARVALMMTQ